MPSSDFLSSIYGSAHGYDASTTGHFNFQVGYTATGAFFTYQNQLTGQIISVTNSVPFVVANGDVFHCTFKVPVVGWSSSVQMSNDTDTRVVAARLSGSTTSIASSSATRVTFTTKNYDTHSAASFTTFVAPVSGFYRASAIAENGGTTAQFSAWGVWLYKNGVYYGGTATAKLSSTNAYISGSVSDNIQLNAGDTVEVYVFQNSGGAISLNNAWFSIERLSGPSVIAASETVACHVETSAGPTITTGSGSAVSFPTKVYDTHNAFSGNTYTVPVSGKYRITALLTMVNTSGTSVMFSDIYVNGSLSKNLTAVYPYLSNLNNHRINGSVTLNLNAGQTVQLFGGSGTAIALFPSAAYNYFIIERIGN
jgi:hypothetical protein